MFGFQRIGDLAWAAGDMRARGFLLGGTAGRTTLNGEGLQHEDGHSHLLASTIPNCVSYDPCFAYELAVIVQDGLRRMVAEQEDVFYYLTVMNENYQHPAMPENASEGILRGIYKLSETKGSGKLSVRLLGSGTILREVIAGAELLATDFGIGSDVYSVTSFNELRRDGLACERWNLLHAEQKPKEAFVTQTLKDKSTPVIVSTDYMKTLADQIRAFIPAPYSVLGTDGFGRSDTRKNLRMFFEVNRYYVVVAALYALAKQGDIAMSEVSKAMKKYQIDPEKLDPAYC